MLAVVGSSNKGGRLPLNLTGSHVLVCVSAQPAHCQLLLPVTQQGLGGNYHRMPVCHDHICLLLDDKTQARVDSLYR